MSGTTSGNAGAPSQAPSDVVRPLPARPSLEFERKRAKKLLRELRRDDPNAKLAEAQFAIAREYGFLSWPRLVEYFETLSRHERSDGPPAWYPPNVFEQFAEGLLSRYRKGSAGVTQLLATFVPRFHGRTVAEVLAAEVTIDDARLLVARENRLPSWQSLMEFARTRRSEGGWPHFESPQFKAGDALRRSDLDTLAGLLDAHPELLAPPTRFDRGGGTLVYSAVLAEWNTQSDDARRCTNWLVSRGADLQSGLNWMLTNFVRMGYAISRDASGLAFVEFLLARGADPAWMPPNGISVLEHCILRAHSPAVVDALARRVTPQKAFWVAAGLGDVHSLVRYFNRDGTLKTAAHKYRPDFTAVGAGAMPLLADASDHDIMWEAAYIAAMNGRTAVIDALLKRGFPVDYAPFDSTLFSFAVGTRNVPLVEFFISRGARRDMTEATPEKLDQWFLQSDPTNVDIRRIYELSGGKNAEEVLLRHASRDTKPAVFAPHLVTSLELAKDDAARMGQSTVEPDNLMIGLLTNDAPPLGSLSVGGVDIRELHRRIKHRLEQGGVKESRPDPAFGAAATAILDAARASAESKRRTHVTSHHLLLELVRADSGPVAELLVSVGGSLEQIRSRLASAL